MTLFAHQQSQKTMGKLGFRHTTNLKKNREQAELIHLYFET